MSSEKTPQATSETSWAPVAEPVLLDVDVALKVCTWRSEGALVTCISPIAPAAMLSIGQYTLRSRVAKRRRIMDIEAARASVNQLLAAVVTIQPTGEEIQLAADFEEAATSQLLELDTG